MGHAQERHGWGRNPKNSEERLFPQYLLRAESSASSLGPRFTTPMPCEKLESQERAKLELAPNWHTWVHFIPLPGASVSLSEHLGYAAALCQCKRGEPIRKPNTWWSSAGLIPAPLPAPQQEKPSCLGPAAVELSATMVTDYTGCPVRTSPDLTATYSGGLAEKESCPNKAHSSCST